MTSGRALLILLLPAFPYLIVCDLLHADEVQNLEKDAKVSPECAEVVSVVIEKQQLFPFGDHRLPGAEIKGLFHGQTYLFVSNFNKSDPIER